MNDIWFHDHIWQRLSNALITYNNEGNILIYMLIAFVPVYLIYRIIKLRPLTPNPYKGIFPEQSFVFNIHDKTNILAAFLVVLAYILYLFLYLNGEMSFFRDEDSMFFSSFMTDPNGGIFISCKHARFFILSHIEWVILYSITPNYYLLSCFVFAQLIFICFLIYRFLDFIEVSKRLLFITLFIMFPAIFAAFDGHIFCERNMIMLLMLGLLAFKKFSRTNNYLFLWLGMVCFNFMLYFKEVNLLFVGGIIITSFVYNLLKGTITPKSFITPLKTMRQFPIEILLSVCCFIFLMSMLHHTFGYINNYYTEQLEMQNVAFMKLYITELLFAFICLMIAIVKICKIRGKFSSNPMFNEGLLGGALLVLLLIIIKKYGHDIPALNTPYFAVPVAIGCILYFAQNQIKKNLLYPLLALFFVGSTFYNFNNQKVKDNVEFHQVYEMIINDADKSKNLNLFVNSSEYTYWNSMIWEAAFEGYNPEIKIKIHGYLQSPKDFKPQKGDYYLFRHWPSQKNSIPNLPPNNKLLENKSFTLYKII